MQFKALPPQHQTLLARISSIGYGRLESLKLQNGFVVSDPSSLEVTSIRMTGDAAGHNAKRKRPPGDFTLKQHQEGFLQQLAAFGNGIIRSITIQDGLPVQFEIARNLGEIEEELAAI